MSKHIIDQKERRDDDARVAQYTRIEAEAKASPQSRALQTRARTRKPGAQLKRFAEIDRKDAT